MCGTCVSVRRCCSASLGSGTARKRTSAAFSAVALLKPKMGCAPGSFSGALPTLVDKLDSKMVEEKITPQKSRIGLQSEREYGSTGWPLRVCSGRERWCAPPSPRSERLRHSLWNHHLHHSPPSGARTGL